MRSARSILEDDVLHRPESGLDDVWSGLANHSCYQDMGTRRRREADDVGKYARMTTGRIKPAHDIYDALFGVCVLVNAC